MKKLVVYIIATLLAAALLSRPCLAEKKKYVLGVRVGMSTEIDAQFKSMITEMAKVYSETHDYAVDLKWYLDDAALMNAVKSGEPQMVFLYNYDNYINLKEKYGFSAFMTNTSYGHERPKACLYVKKENPANGIADLRGKEAATYSDAYEYYLLRELVGEKPEKFFSPLKPLPNGVSVAYDIALDVSDTAFVYDLTISMMKKINPGPVKKLRRIACTPEFSFFPFMISRKAPPFLASEFSSFVAGAHKNEKTKKYWPVFKAYGLKFIPASDADYKSVTDLFKKAEAGGWKKDYDKWVLYAKENL